MNDNEKSTCILLIKILFKYRKYTNNSKNMEKKNSLLSKSSCLKILQVNYFLNQAAIIQPISVDRLPNKYTVMKYLEKES